MENEYQTNGLLGHYYRGVDLDYSSLYVPYMPLMITPPFDILENDCPPPRSFKFLRPNLKLNRDIDTDMDMDITNMIVNLEYVRSQLRQSIGIPIDYSGSIV